MTGAAGVLHRANVGYFIGEEDAYIIVLPGGTFYVSEDGEVAMKIYPIRDQSDEFGAALAKTPFAPKYEDWKDSLRKAPVKEANVSWSTIHSSPPESDLIASDIQKAMNQNKGDEAIIHQLKIARRKMNVGDLKKAKEIVSRYLAVGLEELKEADLNDPVAMKMRAAKDKLAKMRAANAGDDGNDKFFDNAKKIAFLKKEREQLMRDMEQEAEPEGGSIADEYGRKLNKIDAAIAKLSGRKEMDYDTAVGKVNEYDVYMPSQEEVDNFFNSHDSLGSHYLNNKPVMGQEATFNKTEVQPWDEYDYSNWKALQADKLEEVTRYSGFNRNPEDPDSEPFKPTKSVSEFTEDLRALFGKFKGDLKNPEFIKGVAQVMVNWKPLLRSQLDEVQKGHNEKVSKSLKEEEGYSKFLKTDDNPEGKTKGLDTKTMNKILMNVIKDLKEGEPGLWDNIRAKRARGEKPSSKNSKAYKSAVAAGKRINKEK